MYDCDRIWQRMTDVMDGTGPLLHTGLANILGGRMVFDERMTMYVIGKGGV